MKKNTFSAKEVLPQMIEWVKEYFKTNGDETTKAVIGISGGKDSSVAAALLVKALGKDRVYGVLMPEGPQHDIDKAYLLCDFLNIEYEEINIEKTVKSLYSDLLKNHSELNKIVTQNTPSRIRMTTLYAISALVGGRVVNTCNLSEDYVGYSTKFGDSAGDFGLFQYLTTEEVKALGYELNLPVDLIEKAPEDGLSGLTDEQNLGFTYNQLNSFILNGISVNDFIDKEIMKRHRNNLHKISPMPVFKIEGRENFLK